ncbi:MAG: hypothetical protein SFZ24_00950 [Planctomycetota bacterium]|nr:hypothetical protein [Planctomycetota bacterium]
MARLAEAGEYARLLDEAQRGGRPLPLRVRLRLSEAGSLEAAGLGLALQRVVQLTYKPTPLSLVLVDHLLASQSRRGGFGSPGSTAVAVAALLALRDQVASLPGGRGPALGAGKGPVSAELAEAIERAAHEGLHALHLAQSRAEDDGVETHAGMIGDSLDTAIVLWQLALEPRFARVVRFAELLSSVESTGLRHDRVTGRLLERLEFVGRGETSPRSGAPSREAAA